MGFKVKRLIAFLVLALVAASPAIATVLQETIGGKNSNNEYHFSVTSDGKMSAASGSSIELGDVSRTSWFTTTEVVTVTQDTLTVADDSGSVKIYAGAASTDFTLPDCSTTEWEIGFVAATGQTIIVDTGSTLDTIKYLTLDAGDAIDSPGGTGNSISLRCYADGLIVPMQMTGTWTDGGAN